MKKSLIVVLLMALTVMVLSCSKIEKNNSNVSSGEAQEIVTAEETSFGEQEISTNEINVITEYQLTTEPKVLPAGTDGSSGTLGTYVLFGDWPQSLKEDNVTIDGSSTVKVNGWDCYKGNDGYYYVKLTARPGSEKFNNGSYIKAGEEYFFKIEPIKWRVFSNDYQGGKLLVAENQLVCGRFDSGLNEYRIINEEYISEYNYQYSIVRAFLNGLDGTNYNVEDFSKTGFIYRAFTEKALELIKTIDVNTPKSEMTQDKVFLLTSKILSNKNYGFYGKAIEPDYKRKRMPTDLCYALSAYGTTWWLRNPSLNHEPRRDGPYCVAWDDSIGYGPVNHISGYVPALVISF